MVPWGVLLPYLVGAAILAIGLYTLRKEFSSNQGLDKIAALGAVCLAVPISVFGTEHFTAAKILAGMVPAWIPGHLFWAQPQRETPEARTRTARQETVEQFS